MKKGVSVGYKGRQPYYKSEPRWDNSRNVANYGRSLYPVSASMLKLKGRIYRVKAVDDGAGNYTNNKVLRGEAWMQMRLMRTEEIFEYRGKDVKTTHMIKMRYNVSIETTDFIEIDNVTYEVIHVDTETDRRRFKSALCTVLKG